MTRQAYNLDYRIGADLRAVPADGASMQAYVEFLRDQLKNVPRPVPADRVRAVVKLLGEIGAYAVILKKETMAAAALEQSLALIDEHGLGSRAWAIHTLRYGDALRYQKNELGAETAYRSVIELSGRDPEVKDLDHFAWQDLGKLKFEQKNWAEAELCFENALRLRKIIGIKELVEATELVLRVLKMKKPPR